MNDLPTLRSALLDLLHELRESEVKLIIGGGSVPSHPSASTPIRAIRSLLWKRICCASHSPARAVQANHGRPRCSFRP
jgi:hypothetical protein